MIGPTRAQIRGLKERRERESKILGSVWVGALDHAVISKTFVLLQNMTGKPLEGFEQISDLILPMKLSIIHYKQRCKGEIHLRGYDYNADAR